MVINILINMMTRGIKLERIITIQTAALIINGLTNMTTRVIKLRKIITNQTVALIVNGLGNMNTMRKTIGLSKLNL